LHWSMPGFTNEIFSPLGLLRILKRVKSLKTIQMKPEHFKDFGQIASKGSYNKLPYSRVKTLKYEQTNPKEIEYKTSFSEDWKRETVFPKPKTRKGQSGCDISDFSQELLFKNEMTAKPSNPLSKEKKSDIKDMLKFMKPADKLRH